MTSTGNANIYSVTPVPGNDGHATITVYADPPIVPATSYSPMGDGTILPVGSDVTEIMFALPTRVGNVYRFTDNMVLCVYQTSPPPPQLPCNAPAPLPLNWAQQTIDPWHFKLTIPKLGISTTYEYVLFLKNSTTHKLIIVDPPIRCCAAVKTGMFEHALLVTGWSADALAGAILFVGLAVGYGAHRMMRNARPG
jgi:hypothetical protein